MNRLFVLNLIGFLSGFINPFLRNILVGLIVLGFMEIFFIIWIPFVNADVINALAYTQWNTFKHQIFMLVFLFISQLITGAFSKYMLMVFNEHIEKNIRNGVFSYILTRPIAFTEKYSIGDILSRLLNDTPKLKGFITGIVLQCGFDVIAIVAAFCLLIQRSLMLSLIVFAFAPLAVLAGLFFKKKISETSRDVQEKVSIFTSKAQTWISRLLGIKIYAVESEASRQFGHDNTRYTQSIIRAGKWNILMSIINMLFLGSPSILVLIIGGKFCLSGKLSIGELFAFLTFSTYFIAPLQRIIALINVELPKIHPIFSRFKEFGMTDYKQFSYILKKKSIHRIPVVDCLHISYLEYERNKFRLSIPDMSFYRGTIYGIQGNNGCGKTTLAKLLKGILTAQKGKILILDNEQISPDTQIFLLTQNTFFFDGSLQENVCLYEPIIDVPKYLEIVKLLDIEKHASVFDQSNNAERSKLLSGGELQKINIARLFYSDCPILVLDEPDSFVDLSTKKILIDRLSGTKQSKITIIITHDSELLNLCDVVYSLSAHEEDNNHSIIST